MPRGNRHFLPGQVLHITHRCHQRAFLLIKFWGVLVFASFVMLARADEAPVDAFREGRYVLQEWHRNGKIFHPPLVDARFILLNGRFMFISHDRAKEPNKTTVAGFGV